ncbi:hypothetical protein P9112_008398 [Eukaryota sp. TZLM1-RC]
MKTTDRIEHYNQLMSIRSSLQCVPPSDILPSLHPTFSVSLLPSTESDKVDSIDRCHSCKAFSSSTFPSSNGTSLCPFCLTTSPISSLAPSFSSIISSKSYPFIPLNIILIDSCYSELEDILLFVNTLELTMPDEKYLIFSITSDGIVLHMSQILKFSLNFDEIFDRYRPSFADFFNGSRLVVDRSTAVDIINQSINFVESSNVLNLDLPLQIITNTLKKNYFAKFSLLNLIIVSSRQVELNFDKYHPSLRINSILKSENFNLSSLSAQTNGVCLPLFSSVGIKNQFANIENLRGYFNQFFNHSNLNFGIELKIRSSWDIVEVLNNPNFLTIPDSHTLKLQSNLQSNDINFLSFSVTPPDNISIDLFVQVAVKRTILQDCSLIDVLDVSCIQLPINYDVTSFEVLQSINHKVVFDHMFRAFCLNARVNMDITNKLRSKLISTMLNFENLYLSTDPSRDPQVELTFPNSENLNTLLHLTHGLLSHPMVVINNSSTISFLLNCLAQLSIIRKFDAFMPKFHVKYNSGELGIMAGLSRDEFLKILQNKTTLDHIGVDTGFAKIYCDYTKTLTRDCFVVPDCSYLLSFCSVDWEAFGLHNFESFVEFLKSKI